MKKLIGSLILVTLFAFLIQPLEIFAQDKQGNGYSVTEYIGTVANSSQKTVYLNLSNWKSVDSVSVSLAVTNETDIDTINFYRGIWTSKGFIRDAAAGVLYQAVTLDVAAAGRDVEPLFTTNATRLSKANMRGFNGVQAVIEAASSGNDATDPNALYICWIIHGTK